MTKSAHNPAEESFLPLSPQVFGILLALGDEVLHGYAIIQQFEAKTGEKGTLLPGSLYKTLRRMREAGLVAETTGPVPAEDDDPRRRYYAVTSLGKRVARAEAERLRRLVVLAKEENFLIEPS